MAKNRHATNMQIRFTKTKHVAAPECEKKNISAIKVDLRPAWERYMQSLKVIIVQNIVQLLFTFGGEKELHVDPFRLCPVWCSPILHVGPTAIYWQTV